MNIVAAALAFAVLVFGLAALSNPRKWRRPAALIFLSVASVPLFFLLLLSNRVAVVLFVKHGGTMSAEIGSYISAFNGVALWAYLFIALAVFFLTFLVLSKSDDA